MGVFLVATGLRVYAICQQLQVQAQAHAAGAGAGGIVGHTEFRLRMPPSIAFATRGRLQGLRLQLALLDRDFDDLGEYFILVGFGSIVIYQEKLWDTPDLFFTQILLILPEAI